MKNAFGSYIKELRNKRGYSVNELAQKANVSGAHISRLERGLRPPPSPEFIKKLAKALGTDPKELMKVAGYIENTNETFMVREPRSAYPASASLVMLPVLGVIRAGEPIYADEHIIGYEAVDANEVKDGEYFFLRAVGDSMINARIHDGDHVLVRKQDYIEDGQIAVVLVNSEEATIKRIYRQKGRVILQPDNPKYPPMVYNPNDVKILGRVMEVKIKLY